jgi:O-methyltransferase/8-demethyl-8-(2,3-dimethoxy-alpha-L-rhamnosyl)tetracenomycin-C 4'-O-methyltransferase
MAPSADKSREAYLDLIKRTITNYVYLGGQHEPEQFRCVSHYDLAASRWRIDALSKPMTLLTRGQLDLVEQAVLQVTANNVSGDFLEAGIWRGGVIILMRALLDACGIEDRQVVAADSFEGIPKNTRAMNDPVDQWPDRWVASLDEVKQGIARFGLLDDRIEFLPGFFEDTLGRLQGRTFSVIRLDSDSYDSVETSLEYLYPLVPRGGFVIIDDWHLPGCRMAVTAYREQLGIRDPIHEHDGNAYWVKGQPYDFPAFPKAA